jgi:multidrug resistance efflux pump
VPRSRVRIEKVDRRPVEVSITASGTVTPDLQEVIASPVDARVTRILTRAGHPVKAGEAILNLDLSEPRVAFDKLARDVSLKRQEQKRTRLDLQSRLADLEATTEAKRLEVESLRDEGRVVRVIPAPSRRWQRGRERGGPTRPATSRPSTTWRARGAETSAPPARKRGDRPRRARRSRSTTACC